MLRFIVLLLLLMNGVYLAWSQGWLQAYGFGPTEQREPQRLAQQIRPEALRILAPEEARRAEAGTRQPIKSMECLQAGLFDSDQSVSLRAAAERALPTASWSLEDAVEPGRWIVYMGKYASVEAAKKKRAELASLNLKFEPLADPALEPGLSLGGFDTQAAADAELANLTRRGVRTAKVVVVREPVSGTLLRIAVSEDAVRVGLDELKPVLADKSLVPCH